MRTKSYELLRFAATALLAGPLLLLNSWLFGKGLKPVYPISLVFKSTALLWTAIQYGVVVYASAQIYLGRRIGVRVLSVLLAVVVLVDFISVLRHGNYALAFYALFLLICGIGFMSSAGAILSRAYYSSGRRWYEGQPEFIPGVYATLDDGRDSVSAQLSRLDENGIFAYPSAPIGKPVKVRLGIAAGFSGRDLESGVHCVRNDKIGGMGLKFVVENEDLSKDVRDFVAVARSHGYVD